MTEDKAATATETKERPKAVRAMWAAAGFVAFGLGAVGVALPIIPTTPFMLLAAFCFARSSERLNTWFKGTKLYHQVLEGYVTKREMTPRAKLSIIVPVTVLMAIAFILMRNVPVGRIVLALVWAAHIVYFGFIVKTDHAASGEVAVPQPTAASSPAPVDPTPGEGALKGALAEQAPAGEAAASTPVFAEPVPAEPASAGSDPAQGETPQA